MEDKTRPCKSGYSLDLSPAGDRHSARCRPCALCPHPTSGIKDLLKYLKSDLGPMQHFCVCCLVKSPDDTDVSPASWSTANKGQRPCLQPLASRPGCTGARDAIAGPMMAEHTRGCLRAACSLDRCEMLWWDVLQQQIQRISMQTERSEELHANTTWDPSPDVYSDSVR